MHLPIAFAICVLAGAYASWQLTILSMVVVGVPEVLDLLEPRWYLRWQLKRAYVRLFMLELGARDGSLIHRAARKNEYENCFRSVCKWKDKLKTKLIEES
jgi:hypothetical protein